MCLFVESCGDAAEVPAASEHSFDNIATPVSGFVEPMRPRPVGLVGNDWLDAPRLQMIPQVIGVIGFVGQQILRPPQASA